MTSKKSRRIRRASLCVHLMTYHQMGLESSQILTEALRCAWKRQKQLLGASKACHHPKRRQTRRITTQGWTIWWTGIKSKRVMSSLQKIIILLNWQEALRLKPRRILQSRIQDLFSRLQFQIKRLQNRKLASSGREMTSLSSQLSESE